MSGPTREHLARLARTLILLLPPCCPLTIVRAPSRSHFRSDIADCHLGCVDRAVMTLPTPEHAAAITELSLNNNEMTYLAGDAFVNFTNVAKMSLGRNLLTVLPAALFAGMSRLAELDVFGNWLSTILNGTFADQAALLFL